MQHSPHDIKEKLLKALDKDYNVVDMPVVVEIIGILERTPITKEDLETTRLGKYVNELRRKTTNEQVAKRAKDLVRKWRDMIIPHGTAGGDGGTGPNQNGTRPSIGSGRIVSPAIGHSLSPGSWDRNCPISPALSLKRSQPSSPACRINSLSLDNRLNLSPGSQRQAISPNISPRSQFVTSKFNQQLPRSSGEPAIANLPPGTTITRPPEQSTSTPAPRPRGRPPLNRTSLDVLKSPSRPRGRPPLDSSSSDGAEVQRGRGRPPLDPSKAEQRGRGRPPLSSPPSGVVPRGRGRPPKNKNKLKQLASSPECNQNSNLVPKNSPANKRLRKSSDEDEDSIAKKQKLNGVYDCKVPDVINSNEGKAGDDPSQVPSEQIKIPKKRGRKKGSKNAPKKLSFERYEEDVVKEKMASIIRNPKVKTTRELLECIQKESSLDNLRNKTLSSLGVDGDKSKNLIPSHKLLTKNEISDYDMTLSKTEHIHKFLRSQNEAEDDFGQKSVGVNVEDEEVNDHVDARLAEKLSSDAIAVDVKSESRPLSRISDSLLPGVVSESSKSPEAGIESSSAVSAAAAAAAVATATTADVVVVEDDIIDVEKLDSAEDSPEKKSKKWETVEEILAKLPPINPDEISWSESETSSRSSDEDECREIIVTDSDVDWLHNKHIEGVNGNWNDGALIKGLNHGLKVPIGNLSIDGDKDRKPKSKPNVEAVVVVEDGGGGGGGERENDDEEDENGNEGLDEEEDDDDDENDEQLDRNSNNLDVKGSHDDNFREWQECVSKTSYNGELLHILPYVIID